MKELDHNRVKAEAVQTSQDITMRTGDGQICVVRSFSTNKPTFAIWDNGTCLYSQPMSTEQLVHIAKFLEEAASVVDSNPLLNGGYKTKNKEKKTNETESNS